MGDNKTQPNAQAGQSSQASGVAGEVGVPHSSVDWHYFKGCQEPRAGTYSMRGGEAKDEGMAGATRIVTPNCYFVAGPVTGSKLEVPFVKRVFLAGEEGDLVEGDSVQRRGGVPSSAEGGFERVVGQVEIHEEIGVGTVETIVGLVGGPGQNLFEKPEVEVQQERARSEERRVGKE